MPDTPAFGEVALGRFHPQPCADRADDLHARILPYAVMRYSRPMLNGYGFDAAPRCSECGERSPQLERDVTGREVCGACFVPDITSPSWAGNGATMIEVLVAPPNARRVNLPE